MTGEDTQGLCEEIFMTDMKTSDLMNELIRDHDPQDIEEGAVEVIEQTLSEIDDGRRKIAFLSTAGRIGELIESENLVRFSQERLQKLTEKHE